MKPALLVIDVQKQFFRSDPLTTLFLQEAVENINHAIALFRAKNLPVVSIQHVDEAEHLLPGETDFDLPDELGILPEDIHIHKTYGNAFNKTGLLEKLQALGVDTVILSGYCAEYCVLSTARGAEDLDLPAFVLLDCIASGSRANIKFVQNITETISLQALETGLD